MASLFRRGSRLVCQQRPWRKPIISHGAPCCCFSNHRILSFPKRHDSRDTCGRLQAEHVTWRCNTSSSNDWTSITDHLLEIPAGSFSTLSWQNACACLEYWQRADNQTDRIVQSWKLWERILLEKALPEELKTPETSPGENCNGDRANKTAESILLALFHQLLLEIREDSSEEAIRTTLVGLEKWMESPNNSALLSPTETTLDLVRNFLKRHGDAAFQERFLLWHQRNHATLDPPTIDDWNTVLHAWSRSGNGPRAMALLKQLKKSKATPTTKSYGLVLDAWASSKDKRAAHEATALLETMKEPDVIAYNTVLKAWSRQKGGAVRAQELFHRMMHNQNLEPDTKSYHWVLYGLGRSARKDPQAPKQAEDLLKQMEQHAERSAHVQVSVVTFNLVVSAHAQSLLPKSAKRAQELLVELHDRYIETQRDELRPDVVIYNTVLKAWSRHKNEDKADQLLKRMWSWDDLPNPNAKSFEIVLRTWAQSQRPKASTRAHELLEKMLELHHRGLLEERPNIGIYLLVLESCANVGDAERAEQLLSRINDDKELVPTAAGVYNTVIQAWCRSENTRVAGERALKLLNHLCQLAAENNHTTMRPDVWTFSSALHAVLRSGSPSAGEIAEDILLDQMEKLRLMHGYKDLKPNTVTYNSALNCWAKSNHEEAAQNVFSLLRRMQDSQIDDARPDTVSYATIMNAVLHGWSDADAPQKAVGLLTELRDKYLQGDDGCRVDNQLYISVFRALSHSPKERWAVKTAESLLEDVVGLPELKPTSKMLGWILKTIGQSNLEDKAQRAQAVAQTMKHHGVQLDRTAQMWLDKCSDGKASN